MNIVPRAAFRASGRIAVILCTAVLCGFSTNAVAANPTLGPGVSENQRLKNATNIEFGLRDSEIVMLDVETRPGVRQHVDVPLGGRMKTLDLWPHSVRSSDYQLLVQVESGAIVPMQPGPVRTVRGLVMNVPGTTVAGGITDEGLSATIIYDDYSRIWIEPLPGRIAGAPLGLHVIYRDVDVIESGGECGNDAVREPRLGNEAPLDQDGGVITGATERAELAADADFEYFQDYGSVAAVENRINLVTNTMNPQYENQVGITHCITAIIVRTTSNDPYSSNNSGTLLCQFITEWTNNQQAIPFDVSKLFTGKSINGGVIGQAANFGEICDRQGCCGCGAFGLDDGGFCHSENDCCGSLGCATDLMAHELGHLWDAVHCDPCNSTMRSFIGCFNVFGSQTINDIVAFRNSVNCLDTATCTGQGAGACCLPNGSCIANLTENTCSVQGGTWQGEATDCGQVSCDGVLEGACCLPNENCVANQSPSECSGLGGTFQGDNTTCGQVDCTIPDDDDFCAGATALNANSFTVINNASATPAQNDGGPGDPELPGGSPSCQWNDVPSDTHNTRWYTFVACDTSIEIETCTTTDVGDTIIALYSGSCGNLTELACAEDDCGASTYESRICYGGLTAGQTYRIMVGNPGSWAGSTPGSIDLALTCPCPDIGPSTGACCFSDGSCTEGSSSNCLNLGGSYQGNGTDCSPNNCPEATGACCYPNESCSEGTPANCSTFGGTYQGNGTSCDPNPCIIPTGACCVASGNCLVVSDDVCTLLDGDYQGAGSTCSPNNCPQPIGACCFDGGACSVETESDCSNAGGTYQTDGSSCNPNNCPLPTGACCFVDGTCLEDTSTGCASAGGDYQGDGGDCVPNNCPLPTGACCFANGSCIVATSGDCANAGGDYQGNGGNCNPNLCDQPDPTGACCLENGSCTVETAADCGGAGGVFSGNDTDCSPNECPQPSDCPEDINGNGEIEFNDLVLLLAAWGPCVDCPEDINGNDEVEFNDLVMLLAAWGPCD